MIVGKDATGPDGLIDDERLDGLVKKTGAVAG
jgi:hypothetical protein